MPSSIGVYIGPETLEVVVLGGSFSRPGIVSFGSAKLPSQSGWRNLVRMEGPVGGEQAQPSAAPGPADHEAVSDAVRTVLSQCRIPSPKAHVAIAPESVVIRYFQMPAIPAHERRMAIAFEAKKYLPFKLEELVTDYQAIIRRTDPTLMRVMFFGIKRSALDAYHALFRAAGVAPLRLEPAPLSLVRLVRQSGTLAAGQVCAILSIERDTATISIARDDLLYLSRNVSILAGPEAEAGPSNELLDALVSETRVSVDYYRRRFLGEPAVGKVILFGKSIESKRVEELSHALALPVEMGQPFRRILGAQGVSEGLWVATGLALRGLEKRGGEINLLPPEQRVGAQDLVKPAVLEGIAALVVLGLWYGLSFTDLQGLETKIASARTTATTPAGLSPASSLQELRDTQGTLSRQVRLLKAAVDPKASPSRVLTEMASLLPPEAWLNTAQLSDHLDPSGDSGSLRRRVLRLQGSAFAGRRDRELEKINGFLADLRRNSAFQSGFTSFSLDSVQRGTFQTEETTDFALTCATHPDDLRIREPGTRRGSAGRSGP